MSVAVRFMRIRCGVLVRMKRICSSIWEQENAVGYQSGADAVQVRVMRIRSGDIACYENM